MPRRLLLINVVLAAVSVLCIVLIWNRLWTARPPAAPRGRPAVGSSAATAPAGDPRLPPQAYNVIASRNLFSPTRSETAGPALAGGAPVLVAKPALHGVVLREGSPIAYLEDPLTKRIAGYRVGDPIAGGTVQTISADTVVIARPEGMVDVRLRDPSKPRPARAAPRARGRRPLLTPPPAPGAPPRAPGEPPPPLPPVSVGPRTVPAVPAPVPPEASPTPPPPPPPTAPPVPPGQRGRFVVL